METREIPKNKFSRFLNMIGIGSDCCGSKECTEIQVAESKDSTVMPLCTISLPYLGECIVMTCPIESPIFYRLILVFLLIEKAVDNPLLIMLILIFRY